MARGIGLPAWGAGVVWRLAAALALVVALLGGALATPGPAGAALRSQGCAAVDGFTTTNPGGVGYFGFSFNAGEVVSITGRLPA